MKTLNPIHSSVMKKRTIRPHDMERIAVTTEQRETVERVALGIFTDMINAGATFQETLAAIYISGAKHMAAVSTDH